MQNLSVLSGLEIEAITNIRHRPVSQCTGDASTLINIIERLSQQVLLERQDRERTVNEYKELQVKVATKKERIDMAHDLMLARAAFGKSLLDPHVESKLALACVDALVALVEK